jgi:hypothetical protein
MADSRYWRRPGRRDEECRKFTALMRKVEAIRLRHARLILLEVSDRAGPVIKRKDHIGSRLSTNQEFTNRNRRKAER